MMKKLQEAKKQMDEIKARLEVTTVEGRSPNGEVLVKVNGNRKILGMTIVDATLLQDLPKLEETVVQACNNAIEMADTLNETEMKSAAGNMMPGLGGMFK